MKDITKNTVTAAFLTYEEAKPLLRLMLRQPAEDDAIKEAYLDLEKYVSIYKDPFSAPVTQELLNLWHVSAQEIFEAAEQNTRKKLKILDLGVFSALTADVGGGSFLAMPDVLKSIFGEKDLTIIPSSIHEILIFNAYMDLEKLTELVNEVNADPSCFSDPSEVLSSHPYFYNAASNTVAA